MSITQPTNVEGRMAGRLRDLSDEDFARRYGCDRLTAAVLASRFRYIVKHMCTHLMTNAFTPILRDWYDFAATLAGPPELDYPTGAVSDSLVLFTGSMCEGVRNIVNEYGAEKLKPGDILICNDPSRVGTHPNDVLFVRPVFVDGRLIGLINMEPHLMDMGGTVPLGPSAIKKNVYENGLVIPPTLLFERDEPVRSTFSLIFDNARFGEMMLPDILSVAADLRLGERHLQETIERYGVEAYLGALNYVTDVSAESFAEAVGRVADGEYLGEDMVDCDGVDADERYKVVVRIKIAGERVEVDLSGTSREARTSINAGWLDTKTAVSVALKFLLDPKSPFTSGLYRNIDVVLPPGTVTCALPPDGAIWLYHEPSAAVLLAIFRALAGVLGEDAIAGDFCSPMVHGGYGVGPGGAPWMSMSTCGGEHGPWGATRRGDADNSQSIYLANGYAPSIESIEASEPVVVLRKEAAIDSAGPGRNRGGASMVKDTHWLLTGEHRTNSLHMRRPSGFGVNGGGQGISGGVWFWPPVAGEDPDFVGTERSVYRRSTPIVGMLDPDTYEPDADGDYFHFGREPAWNLEAGTVLRYHTNAGGGWGDPLDREVDRVLRDVRNEYVSVEAARDQYGVVMSGDPDLDPEGLEVDAAATEARRAELRRGA